MKKKTLADYLYEVMVEEDMPIIDLGCYGILEETMKRSNCKLNNGRYTYPRPHLDYIIHRVMKTKRGRELFEWYGYNRLESVCKCPVRMIKIKESQK